MQNHEEISKRYNYLPGFNYALSGLNIVVSEREGETDGEISFSNNPNQRIKNYYLDHYRYVQYVRLKTTDATTGSIFDEAEVYAICEFHLTNC
mgnify:CR=1 FL=1